MILRGAVLADKRLSLRAPRPDPLIADSSSLADGAAALVASSVRPAAPLSPQAVINWLTSCDTDALAAVVAHLATDIEDLRLAAERDGFAAGQAQGLRDAGEQTAAAVSLLETMANKAQARFDSELEQLERQCADVIVAALSKVAGPLLGTREAALGAVAAALRHLKGEQQIHIKVNEADLAVLQAATESLKGALGARLMSLIADSRVALGGCIIESEVGVLDARIEVQLAAMLESLRQARGSRDTP